jgi:hypothetical protein
MKGAFMPQRFRRWVAGAAGVAALALGGAVFAQAQSGSERAGGPDPDNVQQGDQTTPDAPAVKAVHKARAVRHARVHAAGSESGSEQSGESASGNDGPGGHADETGNGNANTNHEFQGNE